jgi:superoxide dismutase
MASSSRAGWFPDPFVSPAALCDTAAPSCPCQTVALPLHMPPAVTWLRGLQVWNHTFFWEGMGPGCGGAPSSKLADAIASSFGSFDDFKSQFAAAGATQFGSGWAWLVVKPDGSLEIIKTPNAVCPLVEGARPPSGVLQQPRAA